MNNTHGEQNPERKHLKGNGLGVEVVRVPTPDAKQLMRRAFAQLLTVIQTIAILHQRQRERDAEGRILTSG